MIGVLPETIETDDISCCDLTKKWGAFGLRSLEKYFFSVLIFFCSLKWIFIKQKIHWNTPEFAEFKTGELWKSWSEVDKSWRKLSQQHDPSCSPDFGLQVNPLPSLLTQSPCNKFLRWAPPQDHQDERFSRGKILKRRDSQESPDHQESSQEDSQEDYQEDS